MRRFLFRLAQSLGRTVAEIEETVSPAELIEWMAFDRLEFVGADRGDWLVANQIAQQAGSSKRKYTASDILPMLNTRWKKADDGLMTLDDFKAFAALHNKRVDRGD